MKRSTTMKMTRTGNRSRYSRHGALLVLCWTFVGASGAEQSQVQTGDLRVTYEAWTGVPADIETGPKRWLKAPATLSIRRETGGTSVAPVGLAEAQASLLPLGLTLSSRWSREKEWLAWDLEFTGQEPRSGHEVILELPVLSSTLRIFTPTDQGVADLSMLPTCRPPSYGVYDEHYGRTYVLPLVSVFDPAEDRALTVALPADALIPHLQVEWPDARTLRLTLGHRGMGGGKPSPLRLLFATHQADYRAAMAAYIARYPAYFEPPLPRDCDLEGAFWYHHIQDHPDFKEMERQNVRYIWSSFWFTYLGEFLPVEKEWFPYTYAKWWKLGETMSDVKINDFIRDMRRNRIGTFAYFNVTEYGGNGGKGGDSTQASRELQERFANALVKRENHAPIRTWEGAMVMNPRRQYALFPFLQEQVRRHIERLPDFAGFAIDRLDWASRYDYAHDDGLSMIGDRSVDNMAGTVAEAVQEVCRLCHAAGKRVLVNQFYRVEIMRDVDGTCNECDMLTQSYLTPLRPAAAWHTAGGGGDYVGRRDLTFVEAHLKQRLQIALLPQMIAHRFPISQQPADERAADLMELFTPLFRAFAGKRQVLKPHCVAVGGANDVSLFTDAHGRYVVPVTSRTCFLTRGDRAMRPVQVTITTPDAGQLTWARIIPLGGRPSMVTVQADSGKAVVTVPDHAAATIVVMGRGDAPKPTEDDSLRLVALRDAQFPAARHMMEPATEAPASAVTEAVLSLDGAMLYPGTFSVLLNDTPVGELRENVGVFSCSLQDTAGPVVRIRAGASGFWYLPRHVCLSARTADGSRQFAAWRLGAAEDPGSSCRELILPLIWVRHIGATAAWQAVDTERGGDWLKTFGSTAAWVAGTPSVDQAQQGGFTLNMGRGTKFIWAAATDDPRAPGVDGRKRTAACWFDTREIDGDIATLGSQPYRLTLYLVDFDRRQRAAEISLAGSLGEPLDARQVTTEQMAKGAYLTWTVTGPVRFRIRNAGAENTVLSGVFIDP